ncbi:hypothetical protein FJ987_29750 [Mesorhizobium sp. CU2]|uniref:hypothetical protein n=1 Tax=unclassified Mesorhizobium TaxID=325217 RepID=UPI00112867FE|nr:MULTISPECIES: hypothetical protein [unclassified Mesorhizobium]TPN75449.1 hypothetical protein FJ988_29535 [Mesorhizobium sp. CU3]TPO01736.1 hypothetical protein FJ987_29750 [Mesorhizobium sp. CU2]
MGGGGGGGYSPPINLDKLTEKANQRIQGAFQGKQLVVFVCHRVDAGDLRRRIDASVFREREYVIVTDPALIDEECAKAGLVVCFVSKSEEHSLVDNAIKIASELKKQTIFVHASEQYSMPNYVLQFRVRNVSWAQFLEIFVG